MTQPSPDFLSLPSFDETVLEPLHELQTEGEPGFVVSLMHDFLEQVKELTENIYSAEAAGDSSALEKAAHKLKSSAGVLGLTKMGAICGAIETAARHSSPTANLVDAMKHAEPDAIKAMKLYVANQRT